MKKESISTSELSDKEVINLYLEHRSTTYFTLLYIRYSDKVYNKCLGMLKDEALAQDITQEIFLKIYLNLSNFSHKSSFSTWLYSITYNHCIDYIRRKKKEQKFFAFSLDSYHELLPDDSHDFRLEESVLLAVDKALSEISSKDKAIILMKYQQNMSIKEMAEALNKSESAIKMQLKRAKSRAKNKYRELAQDN